MAERLISVVGLGFGDCGKGLVTDHLVRAQGAHTVLRFNGGAQAGHNVVLADGRHHTFSQFGAGSFSPGVATVLSQPVVVHPTALLAEAEALDACGVHGGLDRLFVDPRCRVTTPFHQAAGRLREWLRGAGAHGSCGAGFGETVAQAIARPEQTLSWADLVADDVGGARARALLEATRVSLQADVLSALGEADPQQLLGHAEWRVLGDPGIGPRWLALARQAARRCAPGGLAALLERLARPGTVVAEGAQGLLLDERFGFHPHTTWSTTLPAAAEAVLDEAGRPAETVRVGVLRSYLTRHGAGPLPTECGSLGDRLAEPHNGDSGWQGRFRRGHADALLMRYAVAAAGALDGIAVTHLDALARLGGTLRWCEAYEAPADADARDLCMLDPAAVSRVVGLDATAAGASLAAAQRLGTLLSRVRPLYAAAPIESAGELLERIEATTGVPVRLGSFGPTHAHVSARPDAHNAARLLLPATP